MPRPFSLSQLLDAFAVHGLSVLQTQNAPSHLLQSVTADSRKVQLGSVFVALQGAKSDGHAFIPKALAAGASLVLLQRLEPQWLSQYPDVCFVQVTDTYLAFAIAAATLQGFPAQKLRLVGVTGTNGKTTVTHLVQRILQHQGVHTALIGTLGVKAAETSLAKGYQETGNTTPLADVLQAYLAELASDGVDAVAMEVSSHALEQHRTGSCQFEVAVLTNLTQDHLDYHVTMERYFEAKAKLFAQLTPIPLPNGEQRAAHAVLNADDAWFERFKATVPTTATLWTYGIHNPAATVRATDVSFSASGACYRLSTPMGEASVKLQMAGEFSIYNSLAALCAGLAMGVSLQECITALEAESGVRGRFEVIHTQPCVIVDYAHTPDGLENVLKAARQITPPAAKLWTLFGCGGDRDATKRPKMGGIAERLADGLVITSDNPRSEQPQQIITDILGGVEHLDTQRIKVEADRRKAIALVLSLAAPEDVVVLAGKGHETYQILEKETIHFDDKEEALAVLTSTSATH